MGDYIIFLNTEFNQEEKNVLIEYVNKFNQEISVLFSVDNKKISGVEFPNRMISVGGLYLVEEKDEMQSWYMGQLIDGTYNFWGNYGNLKDALYGL